MSTAAVPSQAGKVSSHDGPGGPCYSRVTGWAEVASPRVVPLQARIPHEM
jgi:hypothetical protein